MSFGTRLAATAALFVFASAGCHSPTVHDSDVTVWERPVDLEPGEREVQEAAEQFKNKLANFRFPERVTRLYEDGKPVIALLTVVNESDDHFNCNILTDRVREVVTDSQKALFMADTRRLPELEQAVAYERDSGDVDAKQQVESGKGAGARYALFGRLANIRKSNGDVKENTIIFTLELTDLERRTVVLIATKEFRLTKS